MIKIGDRVKYKSCSTEQILWGNNDDPNKVLSKDQLYFILNVEVHKSHTKLSLDGIRGKFNSVCFQIYE